MNKQSDKHCEDNNYQRVRYFHGMLLNERDFTDEQKYHIEKRRLLNRALHGWGVVCGFEITISDTKTQITIDQGIALDCHGNEIVVCRPVTIDAVKPAKGSAKPSTPEECYEASQAVQQEPSTLYIGIAYCEEPAALVPTYSPGGDCEDKACDYSRTQEGFCITLLSELPSVKAPSSHVDLNTFCDKVLPCPPCDRCPEEHFVVLAKIQITSDGKIVEGSVDYEDRTYVLSGNLLRYVAASLQTVLVDKGVTGDLPSLIAALLKANPIAALCQWQPKTTGSEGKGGEQIATPGLETTPAGNQAAKVGSPRSRVRGGTSKGQ